MREGFEVLVAVTFADVPRSERDTQASSALIYPRRSWHRYGRDIVRRLVDFACARLTLSESALTLQKGEPVATNSIRFNGRGGVHHLPSAYRESPLPSLCGGLDLPASARASWIVHRHPDLLGSMHPITRDQASG